MESTRKTKRNPGIKLSTDPQSVAARQRRHRISDRFRVLKSLVPGGSKMDTVSMLEEAINYVKFLKSQIWLHQAAHSMMLPTPQDQHTLNYTTSYNYDAYNAAANINNDGSSSGAYTFSNNNGINRIANEQEEVSYELPPPPPTEFLVPFPYSPFQQEDEMQLINDSYNSINLSYYN